jgi:hypothetical protein
MKPNRHNYLVLSLNNCDMKLCIKTKPHTLECIHEAGAGLSIDDSLMRAPNHIYSPHPTRQ